MTVYVFYRDVNKKDNKVAFIGKSHSHFDITGKDLESLSLTRSLLALNSDFCHQLITFASSLDPDQDRQNVGLDLDPNCLTL